MSKLICEKCNSKLFYPTGLSIVISVYVENGTPPRYDEYRCAKCQHTMSVYTPSVTYAQKPIEVDVPEQDWINPNPFVDNKKK